MIICLCANVSDTDIKECRNSNCIADVQKQTGLGSGCGVCINHPTTWKYLLSIIDSPSTITEQKPTNEENCYSICKDRIV